MKKQRMKHCFFALTLCCTAGSMYGQVAQDSSKTIEKKSSVNGKKNTEVEVQRQSYRTE